MLIRQGSYKLSLGWERRFFVDIPTQWVVTSLIFIGIIVLMWSPSLRHMVHAVLHKPVDRLMTWIAHRVAPWFER